MSQPLVSVIVRAGNHERHIEAALASVYDQDHEGVELVVVVEGAQGRTSSLVRGYLGQARVQSRFRQIGVIEQADGASAPAIFNQGVRASQGTYVNVLHGDERFAPGRLSALLHACADRRSMLAFARVELSADAGASSADVAQLYSLQDSIAFYPTVGYALLSSACALSPGNLLFTRELFDRVGGFADLPSCYDWDFALRSVLITEPVFVTQSLYTSRVHLDGANDARRTELAEETARVLKNYLFLCRTRPVENAVAPSPAWGPFFDGFIHSSRYTKYFAMP